MLVALSPEPQPASASTRPRVNTAATAKAARSACASSCSWQTPGSHSFAKLLESKQVGGERLPVGELRGAIAALRVEEIEQARCAALVRVFADIAVLLAPRSRYPELKQLQNLVVRLQPFVGVPHVGQRLVLRRLFLLLRLRDGVVRARDFALVAVENRDLDAAEKRSGIQLR